MSRGATHTCGVDRPIARPDHDRMDSAPEPREAPKSLDARIQDWLELNRQLQKAHARLEYVLLMLKLGVRLP
jgi:hypothetical protein